MQIFIAFVENGQRRSLTIECNRDTTIKEVGEQAFSIYKIKFPNFSLKDLGYQIFSQSVKFAYNGKIFYLDSNKTLEMIGVEADGTLHQVITIGTSIHEKYPLHFGKTLQEIRSEKTECNRFSTFCSINNGYGTDDNIKITPKLPAIIVDKIGFFFANDTERGEIRTQAKQRESSLHLYHLLKNAQGNNELLKNCKECLLKGGQFIGPRKNDIVLTEENLFKCFAGEENWPKDVRTLMYLQLYIQIEKTEINFNAAKLLKEWCLENSPETKESYTENFKAGLLGKIFKLCEESGLIQKSNTKDDSPVLIIEEKKSINRIMF